MDADYKATMSLSNSSIQYRRVAGQFGSETDSERTRLVS